MTAKKSKKHPPSESLLQSIYDFFSSVRLTVIALALLIPPVILSTLIPQGRPIGEYLHAYGEYGFRIIHFLWLDDVYKSFWFIGLMLLLAANLLVCTVRSLLERKRTWGFVIVHASLLLFIVGGLLSASGRIRGQMQLNVGDQADFFIAHGQPVKLPFFLKLKSFEIQKYENEGELLQVKVRGKEEAFEWPVQRNVWVPVPGTEYEMNATRFVPDFKLDQSTREVYSASNQPNNPALFVQVRGGGFDYGEWVFHLFKNIHNDGSHPLELKYHWASPVIKDFFSHVEVIEDGNVVKEKIVEVNHPLRHRGWSIYQSSYDPANHNWTGLEVVRDPGVPWVYSGTVLLVGALFYNIYFRAWRGERKNGNGHQSHKGEH